MFSVIYTIVTRAGILSFLGVTVTVKVNSFPVLQYEAMSNNSQAKKNFPSIQVEV